jgi:hypothetical protein
MALEGSAGIVWSLLVEHGPVSADDLAAMIAEQFEVETQQVLPDVVSLLTELRSRDVVSWD